MTTALTTRKWMTVACTLVLLASCSDGDAPSEGPPVSSPLPTLPPPPETGHDWEQLYRDRLAQRAEFLGLDDPPTDVGFVQFIRADDYGRVHSECLRGQGFPAEETFDGGIEFGSVPQEQLDARRAAEYRCHAQYPIHPRYYLPLSEEQIRLTYDYRVEVLAPCLHEQGFDPGEPPTWETFLATFDTQDEWFPYSVVEPDAGTVSWEEINELCPQSPPSQDLYGEGW